MKRILLGLILSLATLLVSCASTTKPAKSQDDMSWGEEKEEKKDDGWGSKGWGDEGWGNGEDKKKPSVEPKPGQPPPPPAPEPKPTSKLPKLGELWAKLKAVFPKLPLPDKMPPWALPKLAEALQKKSIDPLIEAYCSDKFPDKGTMHGICVDMAKKLAKAQCAKVKGKVEEACKKLGGACDNAEVKATISKVVALCENAAD